MKKWGWLLFLGFLPFLLGEDCNDPPPPDGTNYWDTDGDGISNPVEKNDANDPLNLDTLVWNDNPSYAHDTTCNGSLEGGLNLVNSGTGYWHYNPESDADDWGTLALINMIEGGGRGWRNQYFSPRIGVGDLSLQNGGDWWPDHACHENGTEVDIRYVKRDGSNDIEGSLDICDTAQGLIFDVERTFEMINVLTDAANNAPDTNRAGSPLWLIIVNRDSGIIPRPGDPENGIPEIRHEPESDSIHCTHLHYIIIDPDGNDN